MGMTVVRLYQIENDKKKYVSKVTTRNKKCTNHIQINLTYLRNKAMVFKTAEEVTQFQFYITNGTHGVNADKLMIEPEVLEKTFEEEFGKDPMDKDLRVELMNTLAKKDYLEDCIRKKDAEIKDLEAIDLTELPKTHQVEVKDTIALITKERDLYILQLQDMLKDEE